MRVYYLASKYLKIVYDTGKLAIFQIWSMNNVTILSTDAGVVDTGPTDGWTFT